MIETRALRKEFGARAAVRGLELSIEKGEVFGLLVTRAATAISF